MWSTGWAQVGPTTDMLCCLIYSLPIVMQEYRQSRLVQQDHNTAARCLRNNPGLRSGSGEDLSSHVQSSCEARHGSSCVCNLRTYSEIGSGDKKCTSCSFGKTQVQIPELTWWLTTILNSNFQKSDDLFWPFLRTRNIHKAHTYR